MNSSTTRCSPPAETRRTGRGGCAPFAALPSSIADDPTISPTDKAILLVLAGHAWGGKDSAWPSNATVAAKVGRSPGHVKRRLGVLERLGLIRREATGENRTGRLIRLLWRPSPDAPVPPGDGASARPESDSIQGKKKERAAAAATPTDGSPPPPGNGEGVPPASAEDLALWQAWASGSDDGLAAFARSALKLAGVVEPAAVRVEHEPTGETMVVASPLPAVASGPPPAARIATQPARQRRSGDVPSRRRQGPRQLLEGVLGRLQTPVMIPVTILRSP